MLNRKEYLKTLLIEESAEVIQCITKCIRFTDNDHHPSRVDTNFIELLYEIMDLSIVLDAFFNSHEINAISEQTKLEYLKTKAGKLNHYYRVSQDLETTIRDEKDLVDMSQLSLISPI